MDSVEMCSLLEKEYYNEKDKLEALRDMGYIEIKTVVVHQYFNSYEDYLGDDYSDMANDICYKIAYDISKEDFIEKLKELREARGFEL